MFDTVIFYISWSAVFVVCYIISHYQFKYLIPVTVFLMKFTNAVLMLLALRLYYLLRVEGNKIDINWTKIYEDIFNALNQTKFDL